MSGAVEGMALPDSELIYQALRFFFWSAGQGVSPINTDDAPEPEETFWQYGLRTGDEEWETVAERYRASLTTPPARSYADGIEDAAKVAEQMKCIACGTFFDPAIGHDDEDCPKGRASWDGSGRSDEQIAAAIRLLSQGEKA